MNDQNDIQTFLDGTVFAVVGASKDREKYGNKVLRSYLQADRVAHPVHPREAQIEGRACFASLSDIPGEVDGVSIITPPAISAAVTREALSLGIKRLWFQPGAEHEEAIEEARAAGAMVIANGPCVLVALGYREE